ncbi:acetylcholinesterase-1 [Trichonephila clavata]|uniref:Carboxylic ester hydrolase n=1 Tax=Trichonephila clavata TaxID=2740835 RepID=A0A8X6GZ23_TRICU|nr:acetylcholinesterase-1 [Trichonephila clavata]
MHKKAVMYWMYGGGFRFGSIQSKLYNGTVLAALGDIVVVTVNYRMGPFGFLFSSSGDAPGNAGLWDVLEGLKWINKNIGFFGGDSSKITISGQSAGAMFINLLSISPLTKGLYSKQIMESGAAIFLQMDTMRQQNLNNSQKIAEIAKWANVFLWPQYGDKIVPINPRIAVLQGNFECTDTLIGNTKDEGSLVLTTQNPKIFGFFGEKNPQINKTFGADLIRDILTGVPDVESIVQHYLSDDVSENAYNFIRRQVYTSFTDEFFLCPSVYYAEKCAEKGNEVYFFKWRHRPSVNPWAPWMGVAHFDEVQFVFGQPLLNSSSYEAEEILLSSEVLNIRSSFVKTGKPRIPWTLYSKDSPSFKYLGPGTRIETKDHGTCKSECEFFHPFFTPK